MKRLRPIRNLYFRFLEGTERASQLTAQDVLECLEARRLIRRAVNEYGEMRYEETEFFHEFSEREILLMLEQFLADKKIREVI